MADSGFRTDTEHHFRSVPQPRLALAGGSGPRWAAARKWAVPLLLALLLFVAWRFVYPGRDVTARVIDFSKSAERIQELSTVKSHIRFAVVVREEGGNVVVRRLAEQSEAIGMDGLGSMLFADPAMIVELHGVATYGIRLNDIAKHIVQNDSTVRVYLPAPEVLDVKLVAADTRIVAQMKGLFRSSNQTLLLDANREGERFVKSYADEDTAMMSLAADRARSVLAILVEQGGKRPLFE